MTCLLQPIKKKIRPPCLSQKCGWNFLEPKIQQWLSKCSNNKKILLIYHIGMCNLWFLSDLELINPKWPSFFPIYINNFGFSPRDGLWFIGDFGAINSFLLWFNYLAYIPPTNSRWCVFFIYEKECWFTT